MNAEAAPGLRRVALGLGFVFAGLALEVLAFCAVLILASFWSAVFVVGGPVLLAATFLGLVLNLVGQLLCLGTPAESAARGPLVLALALNVLGKAVTVVGIVAALLAWWPGAAPQFGLTAASQLLGAASFTAFLVFLKRLARYLDYGEGDLRAEGVLVLWVGTLVLWLLIQGVLLAFLALFSSLNVLGGFTSPDLLALLLAVLVVLFGLLALVFGLLTFFKYCNLLIDLRDTIRRQLDTLAEQLRVKRHGLAPS